MFNIQIKKRMKNKNNKSGYECDGSWSVGSESTASPCNALMEDIYMERRLELSGEGLRFWDLVRTGKAPSTISNFVSGKHERFPLPQVEIDLAGGTWNQNPGY